MIYAFVVVCCMVIGQSFLILTNRMDNMVVLATSTALSVGVVVALM